MDIFPKIAFLNQNVKICRNLNFENLIWKQYLFYRNGYKSESKKKRSFHFRLKGHILFTKKSASVLRLEGSRNEKMLIVVYASVDELTSQLTRKINTKICRRARLARGYGYCAIVTFFMVPFELSSSDLSDSFRRTGQKSPRCSEQMRVCAAEITILRLRATRPWFDTHQTSSVHNKLTQLVEEEHCAVQYTRM